MDPLHQSVLNSNKVADVCERVIIELYTRILEPGSTAIDGGANTGWHTFLMANRLDSGFVYAVEPIPELLKTLRQRASKYGERVRVIAAALSDRLGVADFVYFDGPKS